MLIGGVGWASPLPSGHSGIMTERRQRVGLCQGLGLSSQECGDESRWKRCCMDQSVLSAGDLVGYVSLSRVHHTSPLRTSVWRGQGVRIESRRLRGVEAIPASIWRKLDIDLGWDHLMVVSHVNGAAILLNLRDVLHLAVHVLLLCEFIIHG
jgi:hypothetical protein